MEEAAKIDGLSIRIREAAHEELSDEIGDLFEPLSKWVRREINVEEEFPKVKIRGTSVPLDEVIRAVKDRLFRLARASREQHAITKFLDEASSLGLDVKNLRKAQENLAETVRVIYTAARETEQRLSGRIDDVRHIATSRGS